MAVSRSLLCIPYGGLNDSLVQIAKCYSYAKGYGRRLLVDTSRSGLFLAFDELFAFSDDWGRANAVSIDGSTVDLLDGVGRVFPVEFRGGVDRVGVKHVITPEYKGYVFVDSGNATSFDFGRDYEEDLLVHLNCGGGIQSHGLFSVLALSGAAKQRVLSRMALLPAEYLAVHVRNTDMRSDFLPFFREVAPMAAGFDMLICSDDVEVFRAAQEVFAASRLYLGESSRLVSAAVKEGLHYRENYLTLSDARDAAFASITDLYALALSAHLWIAKNQNGWYSGFSRLAYYLHKNREVACRSLGD